MTTQRNETLIRAPLEHVREILLRPLEMPEWNPAFSNVTGPASASVGDTYDLTIRNGLNGSLSYQQIDDERIALHWETVGFREWATWSLQRRAETTLVVHEFDHE